MKKIIAAVFLSLTVLCGTASYAQEDKTVYSYSIKYNTDCDTEIKEQNVVSRTENTTISITKNIPKKSGYVFLGWSRGNGYISEELLSAGERLKINSSLELFAVWKLENSFVLEYKDGGKNILPSQIVIDGETELSKTIPQKTGYIFCGWQNGDKKEVLLPGSKLEINQDISLEPIWERGMIPRFELSVDSLEDGKVIFRFEGAEYFDRRNLVVRSLADRTEICFENPNDKMTTDTLSEGQYEAWLEVEKSGIKYQCSSVDFAVHSGISIDSTELRLFMNGKELFFDMPPVLLENYTYIALRHFCESMGAKVEWSDAGRCATIIYSGTVIKVFENSNKCIVNGETRFLPVPTRILSSSMFIPLRSIAELCGCEIIWDNSRKVYVFSQRENMFENNIFNIVTENSKFLSVSETEISLKDVAGFESAWVFDAVDKENGIYEIYNLNNLAQPLSVKRSETFDGQTLTIAVKGSFDGFLWRIEEVSDGMFVIQPSNNSSLYLDAEKLFLSKNITHLKLSVQTVK